MSGKPTARAPIGYTIPMEGTVGELVPESQVFAAKLTPLFVGSAITHWYKSTTPLDWGPSVFLKDVTKFFTDE